MSFGSAKLSDDVCRELWALTRAHKSRFAFTIPLSSLIRHITQEEGNLVQFEQLFSSFRTFKAITGAHLGGKFIQPRQTSHKGRLATYRILHTRFAVDKVFAAQKIASHRCLHECRGLRRFTVYLGQYLLRMDTGIELL